MREEKITITVMRPLNKKYEVKVVQRACLHMSLNDAAIRAFFISDYARIMGCAKCDRAAECAKENEGVA